MALLWADNFNIYGTTASLLTNGLYAQRTAEATLAADPDPLSSSTNVLRLRQDDGAYSLGAYGTILRKVVPGGEKTTLGIAFRWWHDFLPEDANQFPAISLNDAANAIQVEIILQPDGSLKAFRNYSNLLGTTAPVIIANAFQHVEIKVTIGDSDGAIEIRVDGVEALNLTAIDTKNTANTGIGQVRFHNQFSGSLTSRGSPYFVKDFIIWDTSGAQNNNFFGTVSVVDILPDSDVSLGGWAPSSGSTGWDILDNVPPVDATYLGADTVEAASFTLQNLPSDVTSVRGLMTVVRGANIDGGDGQLQVSMVSGSDEDDGADRQITTAFTYYTDISEQDPATAAPWTRSGVDAANIKLARTV